MKHLVNLLLLLLLLGCSSCSPLAEPDDYQSDYYESDSEVELEETDGGDIDIQIISQSRIVEGRIGEKVVLPCRVEPEGILTFLMKCQLKLNINLCKSFRPGL